MKTSLKPRKNTRKKAGVSGYRNYTCFFKRQRLSIETLEKKVLRKNLRQREQSRWRKNSRDTRRDENG